MTAERDQHVKRQRAFYERGDHRHLRPRDADPYAEKLVHQLALGCGMQPDERVLEIGAGFGRFSFSVLERCGELVALDVSARALATLDEARERRGIPRARLRTVDCDLYDVDLTRVGEPFDLVIGFFILHHLPALDDALHRIVDLVEPGGRVAFLEPNRRNPLFLAQVACCPDMSWREEKGMFRLSRRLLESACERVGLSEVRIRTFGFFPPQILNRSSLAQRLEERMEAVSWLRGWLPMLLITARKAERTG